MHKTCIQNQKKKFHNLWIPKLETNNQPTNHLFCFIFVSRILLLCKKKIFFINTWYTTMMMMMVMFFDIISFSTKKTKESALSLKKKSTHLKSQQNCSNKIKDNRIIKWRKQTHTHKHRIILFFQIPELDHTLYYYYYSIN